MKTENKMKTEYSDIKEQLKDSKAKIIHLIGEYGSGKTTILEEAFPVGNKKILHFDTFIDADEEINSITKFRKGAEKKNLEELTRVTNRVKLEKIMQKISLAILTSLVAYFPSIGVFELDKRSHDAIYYLLIFLPISFLVFSFLMTTIFYFINKNKKDQTIIIENIDRLDWNITVNLLKFIYERRSNFNKVILSYSIVNIRERYREKFCFHPVRIEENLEKFCDLQIKIIDHESIVKPKIIKKMLDESKISDFVIWANDYKVNHFANVLAPHISNLRIFKEAIDFVVANKDTIINFKLSPIIVLLLKYLSKYDDNLYGYFIKNKSLISGIFKGRITSTIYSGQRVEGHEWFERSITYNKETVAPTPDDFKNMQPFVDFVISHYYDYQITRGFNAGLSSFANHFIDESIKSISTILNVEYKKYLDNEINLNVFFENIRSNETIYRHAIFQEILKDILLYKGENLIRNNWHANFMIALLSDDFRYISKLDMASILLRNKVEVSNLEFRDALNLMATVINSFTEMFLKTDERNYYIYELKVIESFLKRKGKIFKIDEDENYICYGDKKIEKELKEYLLQIISKCAIEYFKIKNFKKMSNDIFSLEKPFFSDIQIIILSKVGCDLEKLNIFLKKINADYNVDILLFALINFSKPQNFKGIIFDKLRNREVNLLNYLNRGLGYEVNAVEWFIEDLKNVKKPKWLK